MYLPISMGPFMAFSKVTTLYFKLRTKLLKIKKFPKNVPLFKYFSQTCSSLQTAPMM